MATPGARERGNSLLARIIALADAYEVMRYGRPYKMAMSQEEIVAELKRSAGTQFDPELVEVLLLLIQLEKTNSDCL